MAGRRDIIYRSDHLTVVHAEHGSSTVIVTFNEMGSRADGDRFWGDTLLDDMKVSAIGFVSARPNWYPALDMVKAMAAVKQRIEGRRAVTYGFSQGGYGALKYGGPVGAAVALGFSPQWSINPADVQGWDDRYIGHYDRILRNGERIAQGDLALSSFIVIDRTDDADAQHADRLLTLADVGAITSPFTGHQTIRMMTEAGAGRTLIERCLDPTTLTATELRTLIRRSRGASATYRMQRLHRLARSAHRHAGFFERALSGIEASADRSLVQVAAAVARGDLAGGADLLAALRDEDLVQTDFHIYWQDFRDRHFLAGERRLAPLYRVRYADDPFKRLHGVNSLIVVGNAAAALEELEAVSAQPGAASFLTHIIGFYDQLGRADLAQSFAETVAARSNAANRDRVRIGFDLVDAYKRAELRSLLYRELASLRDLCADHPDELLRIAGIYDGLNEHAFALQVLDSARMAPKDRLLFDIATVKYAARVDRPRAEAMLATLLRQEVTDARACRDLSEAAERVLGAAAAVEPAQRAVKLTGGRDDDARFRLAWLLWHSVRWREAVRELRHLAKTDSARSHRAGGYASLARQCRDDALAVAFTAGWANAQPDDPNAHIAHLNNLLEVQRRHEAEKAAAHVLGAIAQGQLRLAPQQFVALATQCKRLDPLLERRVLVAAAAAHPDEQQFRPYAAQHDFAAKFFGAATAAPVAAARPGLLARLRPGRRG